MKFHSNDYPKQVKVTIECSPDERGEGIECENLDDFWDQMGVKILAKEFEEAAKDSKRNA